MQGSPLWGKRRVLFKQQRLTICGTKRRPILSENKRDTGTHNAQDWLLELKMRENDGAEQQWVERGKRAIKRYRDESGSIRDNNARFNILWSNVETLFPALYARPPKAEVSRRNKDADPVARTAARILERALQYEIDQCADLDTSGKAAILERLLPGRGVAWVRFEREEPHRPEPEPVEDTGTDALVVEGMLPNVGMMGDMTMMLM